MKATKLNDLEIHGEEGTFFVPHVHFQAQNGKCLMEGEAFLEDTWDFYERLMTWLQNYTASNRPITFDFKLSYFNTSSSKGILELLLFLKEYEDQGGDVTVNWHYPEKDEDSLEEAQDFKEDTGLDINIFTY
ncbi:hypothetical protein OKW21_003780 [Catalinimonas alkaloidigena]|uniref:DUF1987 domain-containing protein n=1 Tax=Catalinimonas alkaloidigena TaxID=1075417 RepID=UPI00240498A5|nr:DUF1987 domain-containing protein [Catalinimonas alkaloidigena]MDF9798517.1 hypothetical protein [Catalinimonas alkaloidigena]